MKEKNNHPVEVFLREQEQLLSSALEACKNCQEQLTECLTTMESLGNGKWPLSKEQKEDLEKIKNEFTMSFDSFKNAFINLLTGSEQPK